MKMADLRGWSGFGNFEFFLQQENLFALLDQSLSLDYNSFNNPFMDCQTQTGFSSQNSIFNLFSTSFEADHMLLPSLDPEFISTTSQDVLSETWNEITHNHNEILKDDSLVHEDSNTVKETTSEKKKWGREGGSSKSLSKEIVSQYYYMPITKAAKELDIGVTVLKKRCRELGIPRWPHRKLLSLETLITNLKVHLETVEGEGNKSKVRETIELMGKQMKMIEENPNLEFEDKTKRLRQACFKAKYKRKRLFKSTFTTSSFK